MGKGGEGRIHTPAQVRSQGAGSRSSSTRPYRKSAVTPYRPYRYRNESPSKYIQASQISQHLSYGGIPKMPPYLHAVLNPSFTPQLW